MKIIRFIIILVFCCGFSKVVSAQTQNISGKDFWVILFNDEGLSDTILFYALSDTLANGSVDNEHYGFHVDFQVIPGELTLLKIPASMIQTGVPYLAVSNKGVRIRSSSNIFLYMQNICTIPDTMITYNWSNECGLYQSPLMVTAYVSDKIPLFPVSTNVRERFPDYDEDWWFYRCNGQDVGIGGTVNTFGSIQCITAMEDNTILYFTYFSNWSTSLDTYSDSILLNKEQSVVLSPYPISTFLGKMLKFSTNCKPVISTTGSGVIVDSDGWDGGSLNGKYTPFAKSHAYQGYDYLCKKLENNRFDKGIFYLKIFECVNPPYSVWNNDVVRYMYNTLVSATYMDSSTNQIDYIHGYREAIRKYCLLTGEHRGIWGSLTSYVSVPYTFLQSSTPIFFHDLNGPYYFIYKESAPGYPIYGVLTDTLGCSRWLRKNPFVTAQPTDRMVHNWVYPTTRNNIKRKNDIGDTVLSEIDTLYVDLQIYVHENGLNTTYFNGQLLPAEVFDSFPMTNGDYYVTQMAFYNEDIPEIIRISNENGFSAYVDEFGYNVLPAPPNHPEIDDITKVYYYHAGASGCFYTDYPSGSINIAEHNFDTVHRCLGDTLSLLVEHNPDSVPVEWIVDEVSHLGDAYSFLLAALDTFTVQCILHYDCPDTTTTFVAVVPPPLLTVAHDTIVCAGATLSVEQPDAISYLWSNGATTPSITVDTAGTFQVSVTNIGCRAESDSFHVSLYGQSSVDFGNDSILCELATLLLDATQPHPAQYFWQDGSTNTTYTVYQDGDYWVVITDHCLGASDTVNIGYLNDFTVSLGPDTVLCEGKTLILSAETPYCDYLWQDGSTQPTYLVRGPGTYSVEVSNRCFSHWDAVDVDYEHCAQELYLPNAFTPNEDALNPVFLPIFTYPDEIEEYRMEIYNRWGTLVFRTEEKTFGWDGANAIDGVYAVVVHYKSRGEKEKTVKGSVTVVR